MSDNPTCGECGGEMTPENSRIHPEYFLHDACLPPELQPPQPTRRNCPRCTRPLADHPAECPITPRIWAALGMFRKSQGHGWRRKLLEMWETANYPLWEDLSAELQTARNILGPSGLLKIEPPPVDFV